MIKNKFILFFLSSILLFSCAQVVPLSGGEKDEEPPKLVSVSPKDSSTNFNSNLIFFEFNEYVQLKNPSTEIIINPTQKEMPQLEVFKKKIKVELKDTLKSNTTYSISFGNSICDVHESNTIKNFSYTFSTGDKIDTFNLSGIVENGLEGKKLPNIFVGLYSNLDHVKNFRAEYHTYSSVEGDFSFRFLPDEEFYLVAFDDKNKNKLFDQNELIAFTSTKIKISQNKTSRLKLFYSDPEKIIVKKTDVLSPFKLRIGYSSSIHQINEVLNDRNERLDHHLSHNQDTLYVYFKEAYKDSTTLFIKRGSVMDTVLVDFTQKSIIDKSMEKSKRVFLSNLSLTGKLFPFKKLSFYSATGIKALDLKRIYLIQSGDTLKQNEFNLSQPKIDSVLASFNFSYGNHYELLFLPGSVVFLNDTLSDTLKFSFDVIKKEECSTLIINNVISDTGTFLLQLLDAKYKVIKENLINSKSGNNKLKITFENLIAGNYSLRMIGDKDQNKKFTNGNFFKNTQPEKIIHYEKVIQIPEGWETELSWEIKNEFLRE